MKLRQHQKEFAQEIKRQIFEEDYRDIFLDVTPGGGKSLIPKMAYFCLQKAKKVEKICWVVPRDNLRHQAAMSMMEHHQFKSGKELSYKVLTSCNDLDPSRDTCGYVTTYQAISRDSSGLNAYEFTRYPYLLVLDEIHHVDRGGKWHESLIPLVESAAYRIYMSGTATRHDEKPIAFLPYIGESQHEATA